MLHLDIVHKGVVADAQRGGAVAAGGRPDGEDVLLAYLHSRPAISLISPIPSGPETLELSITLRVSAVA